MQPECQSLVACFSLVSAAPPWTLTGTELKTHWHLFVLVSSFYIFLAMCARLS